MKKMTLMIVLLGVLLGSAHAEGFGRKQAHYLSISPGFSLTIPVGEFAPAFGLAYTPAASVSFNLSFPWGILGFGVMSGCNIQPTGAEAAYQANLLSIPVAASVRYTTNFASRLFGFVEAAGGIAVNMVLYKEAYPDRTNSTALKPFFEPGAGVGVFLAPWFYLAGYCGFMMIWYDDAPYLGVSPGIRLGFDF